MALGRARSGVQPTTCRYVVSRGIATGLQAYENKLVIFTLIVVILNNSNVDVSLIKADGSAVSRCTSYPRD